MNDNVITAAVQRGRLITVDHRYQYDYGQVLRLEGVDLPGAFEGHFSNTVDGEAITQIGSDNEIPIPDSLFVSGDPIFSWVFVHDGLSDGRTKYRVKIPVWRRAEIDDEPPTPADQSAITQAIAALNNAVTNARNALKKAPKIEGGVWFVWDMETQTWTDTGISASGTRGEKGDKGDPGEQGAPGYSPTVTITPQSDDSTIITITDQTGEHTTQIFNGYDARQEAEGYAQDAAGYAEQAGRYADQAEQAANTAGYLDMYIDENDHLIYTRTDAVDIDFNLDERDHLIMVTV